MASSDPIEDGLPASGLFEQGFSYTYDDLISPPPTHYIDFPTEQVDLLTRLSRDVPLSFPCVVSPMDIVSKATMAVNMAFLGCVAILHSNCSPSTQASLLRDVKSRGMPFLSDPTFVSPSDAVSSPSAFESSPYLVVTASGTPRSKLLGVVTISEWDHSPDRGAPVSSYTMKTPYVALSR